MILVYTVSLLDSFKSFQGKKYPIYNLDKNTILSLKVKYEQ